MTRSLQKIETFLTATGWQHAARQTIAGDASQRQYTRLTQSDGSTAILMDAPANRGEDCGPFVRIAGFLRDHGLSAPQIYHQDLAEGLLLIEDLGQALFFDLMARDSARQEPLYQAAIEVLAALQKTDAPDLPLCDAAWLTEMTDLFFDWYLEKGDPAYRSAFVHAFTPLAEKVADGPQVMMLRDFHAQNLLWLPQREGLARVGLLDFQDAMRGHPAYDLVSILQDARRDVRPWMEEAMINRFLELTGYDRSAFETAYAVLGVQRNLRILGVFARLSQSDGKPGYVDLIPRVWGYLQRDLEHPALIGVRAALGPLLAEPDADFLENLKNRCEINPAP